VPGGSVGHTAAGGSATYVAEVTNVSAVPIDHLVLIDILPAPGDTGVRSSTERGSAWRPLLSSAGSSPEAPVSMSYSSSSNPCRAEIGFVAAGCVQGWSATLPGGLADVRSLRADFGSFVLQPGATARLIWTMSTPVDVTPGRDAWNSFAFVAQRADNGDLLEPTEPAEVGLQADAEGQLSLRIVKRVNGIAAPDPPGPSIPVGDPLVFTYEVTNTGTVPGFNLEVLDDVLGRIPCPQTTLAPGESMICTAPRQLAIAGPQTNIATLLGSLSQDGPAAPVALDVLNYTGNDRSREQIVIVKMVNGQVARRPPGPNIPAGQPVGYTYKVKNQGAVPVNRLAVSDDRLTGVTCALTALRPNEQTVCTAPPQVAVEGGQVNIATATAQPLDPRGTPTGGTISATDRAYYSNTIAVTGSRPMPMAALAAAMVAVGLGLLGVSRRRPIGSRADSWRATSRP
jgi:hypothetical protein